MLVHPTCHSSKVGRVVFFELQMSESLFTGIVRNRIRNVPLCVDQEFPDLDGIPLAIDRIEVGSGTEIQRQKELPVGTTQPRDAATQVVWIFSPTNYHSITVPFLQVKQEILIHLVKVSDLQLNGPNPSPVHRTLTIRPVFDVSLSVANQAGGGGPLTLSYKLAYVDLGLLGHGLSEAQRAEIDRAVAGVKLEPTTLDFGPLTSQIERPMSAINAGIACDPAGSFIAMRVDFDVYATPPRVDQAFFEAGPVNRLTGGSEWAMLIDADILTDGVMRRARKGLEGAPNMRVNSGPTVVWEPAAPALVVNADVELIDACKFFVDDIDMDAHVRVRSSFSVPTPNVMRTHHELKGEPSDLAEEVACALTAALLWPFLGTAMLETAEVDLDKYILLMILPPYVRFLAIMVAIETAGSSANVGGLGENCTKLDDSNYQCDNRLDIVMPLSPPFNSRFDLRAVTGVDQGLVLSGTVSNLGTTPVGELDRVDVEPFAWQVLGECTGNGRDNFRVGSEARIGLALTPPARLCSARIVDDVYGEFAIAVDYVAASIAITPRSTLMYTAMPNPYPCEVRIVTTRGVRRITLPPPSQLETAEAAKLEQARIRAVMSCYVWDEYHSPMDELSWVPDPPPPDVDHTLHLWQIVLRGLEVGETVHVQTSSLGTILVAHASPQGVADMTLLFDGDSAPAKLALELAGGGRAAPREFSMQQVLYVRQATLPAEGELHEMRLEGGSEDRRLVVADEGREMMWRVSSASVAPTLLSSIARPADRREDGPVVQTGKRVGGRRGGSIGRQLKALRERDPKLDYVGSPRIGGVGEALAVREGDRSTVYDVSRSEPEVVQVFEGLAWFEGTALGGDMLAKHDPDAGAVHLYAAVARDVR
jgi:hypothetical protein